MKTNYFFTKKTSIYSILGVLALMATSCGSYQNTSYYDNDGVYGSTEKPKQKVETNNNSGYYKDYFSSLNKENEQVFTDVDKYSTYNDTLKKTNTNQNNTEVQNTTGYASWGSNPDNVTVNVYNSGWGYNSWYGPSWGYYGGGYYGNSWGYNGWYGNSWGYSPSWSWGWNSWYGPSWYGYGYGYNPYGYGYYPYGYGYYGNNWGWNNGSLGHNYAYSGGRRNSNFTGGSTYGSPNRSMSGNGGRSSLGGTRVVGEPSSMPRSYNNTGSPRSSYAPRTNETVSPRSTTPNNNYNSPRSYTPSTPSSPSSPRSYTPSTPRSYDSPRSYTPSGGGSYGGGGGSYGGGGGGGRSGGGGGRR